jgi:hypothetical protein
MRKIMLVVASVAVAMVVLGGVAWAATIQCPNAGIGEHYPWHFCQGTDEDDILYGTSYSDQMGDGLGSDKLYGYRGLDRLTTSADQQPNSFDDTSADYAYGGRGPDRLNAGFRFESDGVDHLYGGRDNDLIKVSQRESGWIVLNKDVVNCGPGNDTVVFDQGADVIKNCETKIGWSHPR